jgi:hypothetical protein
MAEADATYKVATEKCEAFKGAAQKDCKDKADAAHDQARKQAEITRDGG